MGPGCVLPATLSGAQLLGVVLARGPTTHPPRRGLCSGTDAPTPCPLILAVFKVPGGMQCIFPRLQGQLRGVSDVGGVAERRVFISRALSAGDNCAARLRQPVPPFSPTPQRC